MAPRRLFAFGSSVFAIVAACSSFEEGDSPDLGGNDASPDGASSADGAAPDGCTPGAHFLCEDFASEALPSPVWAGKQVVSPGMMSLVTDRFVSGPRGLRVDMDTDGGGGGAGTAVLLKDLPPTLRTLACSFSVYPDKLTDDESQFSGFFDFWIDGNINSGFQALDIRLGLLSSASILRIAAVSNEGGFVENTSLVAGGIQLQDWSRVRIEISFDTKAVKVTVGTQTLFDVTSTTPVPAHNGGTLRIGLFDVDRETHAFIDDIVCD